MKILLFLIVFISMASAQTPRTEHWYQRNKMFNSDCDTLEKGKVIFLGNSITEGFDLNKFFPVDLPVNRGIAGDHIDGLIERLDSSVLILKPSRIYLLVGINDIGRGDSDSLILKRYNDLLSRLNQELPGTPVYVFSILPTSARWTNCPKEKIIRLNNHIKKMTVSLDYNWSNLYPLFAGEDGYLRDELTIDGLHLNMAGYEIWTKQLRKTGLK